MSAENFIHAMRDLAKASGDRNASWETRKHTPAGSSSAPRREVTKVEKLPTRDNRRFREIKAQAPSESREPPVDLGALLRAHTEYTSLLIETLRSRRVAGPEHMEGSGELPVEEPSPEAEARRTPAASVPSESVEVAVHGKAETVAPAHESPRVYTPDSASMGVLVDAHLETRVVVMPRGGKRILFPCPHCSHRLVVRLRHHSTVCRCEECQGIFRAPILDSSHLEVKHHAFPFDAEVGRLLLQKQMSLPAHRRRRRLRRSGQFLAVSALLVMLFALHSMGGPSREDEAQALLGAEPLDEHDYSVEATEVVKAFLAADGWEAKSRFVRDPERVRSLMKDYYVRQGHDDGPQAYTNMRYSDVQMRTPMLTSQVDLEIDHQKVRGFAVEHYPSGPRIEWESHVIYNKPTWADFLREKPVTPTTMRVAARLGSYFNFQFDDPETFLCVELSLPGHFTEPVYAYAEKDSGAGLEMMEALMKAPPYHWVPIIADLAFPEAAKGNIRQLNILRVREKSWRVPDGGFRDGPDETDLNGPLRSASTL